MKNNLGKIYKMLAIIIGLIGVIGNFVFAYCRAASITGSFNVKFMKSYIFFGTFLSYVFTIFIVCLIIYGIGHIIEILQSINKNMSNQSIIESDVRTPLNSNVNETISISNFSQHMDEASVDYVWSSSNSEDK